MDRVWRRRIGRLVLAALIALLLMLVIGPEPVRVQPETHVVQTQVPTDVLVRAMEDLYDGAREREMSPERFVWRVEKLWEAYGLCAGDEARETREQLIARYTEETER